MPAMTSQLSRLFLVDATTCAAMGALLTLASGLVATLTGIPSDLLFYLGLALFPVAALMAAIGSLRIVFHPGAWLIIAGNAGWVVGSFALAFGGWIAPNALGTAFIVVQALVVAALAWLEYGALRQTAAAAPAM